jgi:hypothetical protein
LQDLQNVKKIALSNGIRVELTKTADGRHSDFAPAIALIASIAPKIDRINRTWRDYLTLGARPPSKAERVSERIEADSASGISPTQREGIARHVPLAPLPNWRQRPPPATFLQRAGEIALLQPEIKKRSAY